MARDLAEVFPAAREVLQRAERALGLPLADIMFHGPAETLTLTHNAQPALFAHGMAVLEAARSLGPFPAVAAAGHSLGEFTAYCAAGSYDLESGIRLVRKRGELMHEAGTARAGTMAAVLGALGRSIADICAEARDLSGGEVLPANFNAPDQVVVSGDPDAVERAMELARAAGARRVVKLSVSGAFHSPLMNDASAGLWRALEAVPFLDPQLPVYSNVTAEPVSNAATARALLARQLTEPVRWTDVVQRLVRDFPQALFVEMGPGAVLTGLLRRTAPEAEVVSCGTVAELEALRAKVTA
jgi:[acyl-carrier-protein] S-malonyltransferase